MQLNYQKVIAPVATKPPRGSRQPLIDPPASLKARGKTRPAKFLLAGVTAKAKLSVSGSCGPWDYCATVKRGHSRCGDSAFVCCDANKAALGVFDGMNGLHYPDRASSAAARAALSSLSKMDAPSVGGMNVAFDRMTAAIRQGETTALLASVRNNGSFLITGAGDSLAYVVTSAGDVESGIRLDKSVGDGTPPDVFFATRNRICASVESGRIWRKGGWKSPNHWRGKLKKGEVLILASDGLSDNLGVKVQGGVIRDSAGTCDLAQLISKERSPDKIVRLLMAEIGLRLAAGLVSVGDTIIKPKKDDIAIVAIRFK